MSAGAPAADDEAAAAAVEMIARHGARAVQVMRDRIEALTRGGGDMRALDRAYRVLTLVEREVG